MCLCCSVCGTWAGVARCRVRVLEERVGPRDRSSPGRGRPLQFRHECELTAEAYVIRQAWREASPPDCLVGLDSGCGQWQHGTYRRKKPVGMRISRWYCRDCGVSFSALPDCLCARLPGSLSQAEEVVLLAESHGISAAAREFRPDALDFRGARRWVRRRVFPVRAGLSVFRGLDPVLFAGLALLLGAFRERLAAPVALVALRGLGCGRLACLPYPVGFDLRRRRSGSQTGPPTEDDPMRRGAFRRG